MADLADVERMVDGWERDAVAKSQRYQQMQALGAAVGAVVGELATPS